MWVRNSKGNVFVGNLPPDFSDERLAEAFDPFGIVLSAAVARDPNTGARLRYGFVDIATERAATKAITALDGTVVDGCKLNVKASEKKAKVAGAKPGPRRQPPRPPVRRMLTREAPEASAAAEPRMAQSAIAREQVDAIEPPPRRNFEVVVRPARRRATPNFQVERRALPRRV
ncbi:MAG TPA: RNA-binding protein [Stellaceae bacterium]|jgi:RNA recognition motif-containing protein|nr:RNA-binding protein [Stellaceae bacterium]